MATDSPRKRKQGDSAPLPISALPLPVDEPRASDSEPGPALPTNASGELTPAQRARLGLDIYGDPPAPTPIGNANGSASDITTSQPGQSAASSEFGFSEIDPYDEPAEQAAPEPRLTPAKQMPALAPVTPAAIRVRQRARDDADEADRNAASRRRGEKQTVAERDGTPQIDRDRKVLTYGFSWTIFCLVVTIALSFSSSFSHGDQGPSAGTFVPALVSILIGWVIVFVARNIGRNWGWLMLIPAVVLVLGPFFYTTWSLDRLRMDSRAYLSGSAVKSSVDIDKKTVVSETINTPEGCFAFTQLRDSGDVTVDVVTYAPMTAQQQATLTLSPRYARRVEPGGTRAAQRTFTLERGTLPVIARERLTPPIDCANAGGP